MYLLLSDMACLLNDTLPPDFGGGFSMMIAFNNIACCRLSTNVNIALVLEAQLIFYILLDFLTVDLCRHHKETT